METSYQQEIDHAVQRVFDVMEARVTPEELQQIKKAYEFAREAHKDQKRKSGQPYIIHPILVARICAEELKLDAHSVMAAFLHDVVEDTPHTTAEIEQLFGADVAFLVNVVTKKKKKTYKATKQVDNFEQLLDSVQYDIRALMLKLADRLHNMRTLASMRPDKQMKIAGETDYFYAPLANRLGLFDVKTDLENLAFKYRCEVQYNDIEEALRQDVIDNKERLATFVKEIDSMLYDNGIFGKATVYYRRPYSIWRRMKAGQRDFKHVENRYYVRVTFFGTKNNEKEKDTCLRIYSLLTDQFKEKPLSFNNLIDQAKENAYKCISVMLLSDEGIWEDVQICSENMVEASRFGCLSQLDGNTTNIQQWINKFRQVLQDMASQSSDGNYMENVVSTLYYDDIMVFQPDGTPHILPKDATAIDFAFDLDANTGLHAKYARINGKLSSVKTVLKRGDCVEIGVGRTIKANEEWLKHCLTYKAERAVKKLLARQDKERTIKTCPLCRPIPGGEVIGFKDEKGMVTVHRRNCPEAISLASKLGDSIVTPDFNTDPNMVYPVTVYIRAIDRTHLLIDLIDNISNKLQLSIDALTTTTQDEIVECTMRFFVHSVIELTETLNYLYTIAGVDEVRQVIEE